MKAYNRLREYVDIDKTWKTPSDEVSDFDRFCMEHDDDITNTLDCIDAINDYIDQNRLEDFDDDKVGKEVIYQFGKIKKIISKIVD